MKNQIFIILTVLMFTSVEVSAQNTLLLKNKQTGKQIKISENSNLTFQLYNSDIIYSEWKIERLKDTSLIASTYSYCKDSITLTYNEMKTKQIPYSSMEYVKFQENNGKKIAAGWGMMLGGFLTLGSPLIAYDSEKKHWSNQTFYISSSVGSGLFAVSYYLLKKLQRKEQYFDTKEWNISMQKKNY